MSAAVEYTISVNFSELGAELDKLGTAPCIPWWVASVPVRLVNATVFGVGSDILITLRPSILMRLIVWMFGGRK